MTTERHKIAARIRALMAKTVENGCTEDEAVSAAKMVATLLAKYNMSLDETVLRENPFAQQVHRQEDEIGERLWKVAAAISELTGSRYWRSPAGVQPVEITFFGFEHEVEVSQYLLAICVRALKDAKRRFNKAQALLTKERRRRLLLSFLDGMVDRLAERIRAQIEPVPTGTGLMVIRNTLIDDEIERRKIALRQKRERGSRDFDNGYENGVRAGDKVALNRGIDTPQSDNRRLLN